VPADSACAKPTPTFTSARSVMSSRSLVSLIAELPLRARAYE
jgi:hypothetical protein